MAFVKIGDGMLDVSPKIGGNLASDTIGAPSGIESPKNSLFAPAPPLFRGTTGFGRKTPKIGLWYKVPDSTMVVDLGLPFVGTPTYIWTLPGGNRYELTAEVVRGDETGWFANRVRGLSNVYVYCTNTTRGPLAELGLGEYDGITTKQQSEDEERREADTVSTGEAVSKLSSAIIVVSIVVAALYFLPRTGRLV